MQNQHVIFNKVMLKMLLVVAILVVFIVGYKIFSSIMMQKYMSIAPIITVSSARAEYQEWLPLIKAVGSTRTKFGVDLSIEIPGIISNIYVASGKDVEKDDLIFALNTDNEMAQLQSLQAAAGLAKTTYLRDQEQYTIKAISQAKLDADLSDLTDKEAQVVAQMAIIAKKIITAPFAGRLGIITASTGQYVSAGDKIVTLQNLDPIFIDFNLPQQQIDNIKVGQAVTIYADPYKKQKFIGKITSINPKIDVDTRNIMVEAQIDNPDQKLLPGMFASIEISVDAVKKYLTLPKTAISFNSYGDLVYIIEHKEADKGGNTKQVAIQKFVTVGESRGNRVAILSGIKDHDEVVTSGQLKLKNGSAVSINNSIIPDANQNPTIVDE